MKLSLEKFNCVELRIYFHTSLLYLLWERTAYGQANDVDNNNTGSPNSKQPTTTVRISTIRNCTVNYDFDCKLIDDERVRTYLSFISGGAANYPPPYVYHPHNVEIKSLKPNNATVIHGDATIKFTPWVKLVLQPLFITRMTMKLMEFSIDFKIYITWEDGRLKLPGLDMIKILPEIIDLQHRIRIFNKDFKRQFVMPLWLPNIKFTNCNGKNEVLIDPEISLVDIRLMLYPWIQRLTSNYKFSMDFFCPYKFTKYPFDKQQCSIKMEYTHGKPKVNWITEVLMEDITEINVPPEYQFMSVTNSTCRNTHSENSEVIECVEFVFIFQRIYNQHIMLLFIPSLLIVSLTWISFWLDESAAPPRVALGLTSLLTLATQFNSAQKDLPAVAEIKAIDVWMFACMIMVFASLVEFAIANYSFRKKASAEPVLLLPEARTSKFPVPRYNYSNPRKPKHTIKNAFSESSALEGRRQLRLKCCTMAKGNKIDIYSRIIFPTVFLVFNIVFWVHYAS